MSDTTAPSDRQLVELFVQLDPVHDRVVYATAETRARDEQPGIDPFSLDGLQRVFDTGMRELYVTEQKWLLAEAYRLARANRALDALAAELERKVRDKDADYTGVCLEYSDLSDENTRLKQEVEINKIVLEAKDNTIKQLQAEVAAASAPAS